MNITIQTTSIDSNNVISESYINADATLISSNNKHEIKYTQIPENDNNNSNNSILTNKQISSITFENDKVTIKQYGEVDIHMPLQKNETTKVLYNTQYGTLEFNAIAQKINFAQNGNSFNASIWYILRHSDKLFGHYKVSITTADN